MPTQHPSVQPVESSQVHGAHASDETWKGTASGGALTFPASGQTWPTLAKLFLGASRTITPKDITGTIDANDKVDLTLSYDTLIKASSNECTLTGAVQLSSQGTEKLGGQAVGKNWDPTTGQFAVVSTTYTAPAAAGSCFLLNAAYDVSKGMGWYMTADLDPAFYSARGPEADRHGEGAEEDQAQGQPCC